MITSPPRSIAVTVSPGMPSTSRGIMAPPMEALLDASEATTPSMIPVPNFSGSLLLCRATLYAMMLEVPPPIPGRMPIPIPISEERIRFQSWPAASAGLKPKPLI